MSLAPETRLPRVLRRGRAAWIGCRSSARDGFRYGRGQVRSEVLMAQEGADVRAEPDTPSPDRPPPGPRPALPRGGAERPPRVECRAAAGETNLVAGRPFRKAPVGRQLRVR